MEPISGIIFGIVCAIVADSRGRSALGWFFIGFFFSCIGLLILVVLPDLKVMERRENEVNQENRRLREQIRRDRAVSDSRFSETMRRLDDHDDILQVDTSTPPSLPREFQEGQIHGGGPLGQASSKYLDASWWYADPREAQSIGPIAFPDLQQKWHTGDVYGGTLVWCEILDEWEKVDDVFELRERLDA